MGKISSAPSPRSRVLTSRASPWVHPPAEHRVGHVRPDRAFRRAVSAGRGMLPSARQRDGARFAGSGKRADDASDRGDSSPPTGPRRPGSSAGIPLARPSVPVAAQPQRARDRASVRVAKPVTQRRRRISSARSTRRNRTPRGTASEARRCRVRQRGQWRDGLARLPVALGGDGQTPVGGGGLDQRRTRSRRGRNARCSRTLPPRERPRPPLRARTRRQGFAERRRRRAGLKAHAPRTCI